MSDMSDSQVLAAATGIMTYEAREIIEREDARSISARCNLFRALSAARDGEPDFARILVREVRDDERRS